MNLRKRKVLVLSPEAIINLLKAERIIVCHHDGRTTELTSTLPPDAEGFRAFSAPEWGTVGQGAIAIMVASETFEEVPDGGSAPELTVTMRSRQLSPPRRDPDDGSIED